MVMTFAISKNFYKKHKNDNYIYDHRDKKVKLDLDLRLLDTRILVYEDMVKTWFLQVAKYLCLKNKVRINKNGEFDTNEAGFVILQIATSYIEGNQQYREGKSSNRNSMNMFRRGIKRIFNLKHKNNLIDKLYEQVRCGLFHDGMTRKLVTIDGNYKKSIILSNKSIKINPYKFLNKIEDDFDNYILELKDTKNTKLKRNFENFLKTR